MERKLSELAQTIRLLNKQYDAKLALSIASQIVMQKEIIKEIEMVHFYPITEYKDRYRTRVFDPNSKDKRKQLYAKSIEEIYIKLIEWYGLDVNDAMTMTDLYERWIDYRLKTVPNKNTVARNEAHYNRYFNGDEFWTTKIESLKKPMVKEYCVGVITKNKMTNKEWGNVKTILRGMFNYAVENDWMAFNPLDGMTFPRALFVQPKPMVKENEIFNSDESKILVDWCEQIYAEEHDVAYLFPILNINIGMRIGEAAGLTWDDWDGNRHLRIHKEEVRNQYTNETTVVEHTKTYKNRTIILTKTAEDVLTRLKEASNPNLRWMFHRGGMRLRARQLAYVLERFAKENGVACKSSHKLRKTFGSNLYAKAGFTPKQCADYLGNTEEVFIYHYNFDVDTDKEFMSKLDAI